MPRTSQPRIENYSTIQLLFIFIRNQPKLSFSEINSKHTLVPFRIIVIIAVSPDMFIVITIHTNLWMTAVFKKHLIIVEVLYFGNSTLAWHKLRFGYGNVPHHSHVGNVHFFVTYLFKSGPEDDQQKA